VSDHYKATDGLISEWRADYIKFQGRRPRNLEELAIAEADSKYRGRLAEIKAMAKQMQLLDEFRRPLMAKHGIALGEMQIDKWGLDRGVGLRVWSMALAAKDDKLRTALIALGFREIERKDWRSHDLVLMKHGRWLVVAIDAPKPAPKAAESPTSKPDSDGHCERCGLEHDGEAHECPPGFLETAAQTTS